MRKFPVFSLLAVLLLPAAPSWAEKGINSSALIAGRYQDKGDGTVTDVKTKLMWMRCSVGQTWTGSTCSGDAETFLWAGAKKQTANFAGHSDWRIPTIEELRTLVYCSNGKPDYFNQGKPGREEYEAQGRPDGFDLGCQGEPGKDHQTPAIAQSVFPNTPSLWFWSGSPYASNSNYAWNVGFNYGYDYNYDRYYFRYVRLVRGGQ
jgi:hypothetical protein